MTIEQMKTLLSAISGFSNKVTYYQWPIKGAPELPYICFYVPFLDNFGADNKTYFSVNHFIIEFYSELKDPASEQLIETALADFYWNKSESYIEEEKLYQIIYELEV